MKKYKNCLMLSPLILITTLLISCQPSNTINEKEWDLLFVSDSSGWNVADIYGEMIAEDMGVTVNVLDQWKGGLPAKRLLNSLRGELGDDYDYDMQKMRETVAQAEVIVVYGNPEGSVMSDNPWDFNCGQGFSECYVNNCSMESFQLYIDHLKEIYSLIFELRKGKPTLIRTFDAYNPNLITQCAENGTVDVCLQCWENYNQAIHTAADEMGIPVANVFDAWNGPDHREDPTLKGYTQPDGEHPNETGARVIAQTLRDLGYDPITP
jgi:hypothetical protein